MCEDAVRIQDDDRLVMHAEDASHPDLEQLLERAQAARKSEKRVRTSVHLALAHAHVRRHDELVRLLVGDLPGEKRLGDDADRPATARPCRTGDSTHARHTAAARDERVPAARDLGTHFRREIDVLLRNPLARRAEDADRRHQPSTGLPSAWLEGGTMGGARPGERLCSARSMMCTASSTSAVSCSRSRSATLILWSLSIVVRSHSRSPVQYAVPNSTTGNDVTLPVCTSVNASNSSSIVPKPPGMTMNACAYFTNIVLRAKK